MACTLKIAKVYGYRQVELAHIRVREPRALSKLDDILRRDHMLTPDNHAVYVFSEFSDVPELNDEPMVAAWVTDDYILWGFLRDVIATNQS